MAGWLAGKVLVKVKPQKVIPCVHLQYELIECIGWVSDVQRSAAGNPRAAELIDSVRKQIATSAGGSMSNAGGEQIELLNLLGEGSVSGRWRLRFLNVGYDPDTSFGLLSQRIPSPFSFSLERCTRGGGGIGKLPSNP